MSKEQERDHMLEKMEAMIQQLDDNTAKELLDVMQKLADSKKTPDVPFDMIGALEETGFWQKFPENERARLEKMWEDIKTQ